MNLTRLELRVLAAIKKAHRPVTAVYIAILLDRRTEPALEALEAAGLIVQARGAYRPAPPPMATDKTRWSYPKPGYADGYGWGDD